MADGQCPSCHSPEPGMALPGKAGIGVPHWASKGYYVLRALENSSSVVLIKAENCL